MIRFLTICMVFSGSKGPCCEQCALADSGEPCAMCFQPITGAYLDFNGKNIHTGCLRCLDCNKTLFSNNSTEAQVHRVESGQG